MIGRRSRYGDQVLALVFVVLRRSSAAHAALDLTGAKNLKANTCQPSHLLLRRRSRLDAIQDGLDYAFCHFNRMQVRPEHATAFFSHVIQGFVAGFVGATQVQGYVDQSVLGGNVRVDGEEWVMAGRSGRMGGRKWKEGVDQGLFFSLENAPNAATYHYHVNRWRLYAGW